MKIQKAREKQQREKEDQEEMRKREKAKQKRNDEKAQQKEELARMERAKTRIEMERELLQARNMRDVEDQEQKMKGKSGFGLQTENNMKDSTQQARVDISQALLPPSKEWGMYMI